MRNFAALGVTLFALLFSVSCGAGQHSGGDGKANGISLNLRWPDGYHFDSATRSLVAPAGAKSAAAPVYVISATVYAIGEEVEPETFAIPLDTGIVDGTLPAGFYTFYVEVVTDLGYVFTGQAGVTLVPGPNGDITIDLEVNSPPEILDIIFSPAYAAPGDTVFLEAIVEDLDPDDVLTYTWIGYGVDVFGSGPTASFVLPYQTSGSIGVTLYVEDGQGGIAWYDMGEVTDNQWPWIDSVTSSNYSPFINDVVTLTCNAHDDDGDTLDYFWYDGNGWFDYGPVTQYTVPTDAAWWITCEVYDGRGGYDYNWVTLNMGSSGALAPPTGLTAVPAIGGLQLTWGPVADATSYKVYYSITSPVTTSSAWVGESSTSTILPALSSQTLYVAVTATNANSESALSNEVSATSNGDGVSGVVYYNVATQDNVYVDLCSDQYCGGASDPLLFTATSGGGLYDFQSLPAGTYYVIFYAPGGWQQTHIYSWSAGPIVLDGVPAPATQDLYLTKDVHPIIQPATGDGAPLVSGQNSLTVEWTANPDVVGGYDLSLYEIVGPTATLVEGPTNVPAGTTHTFAFALDTNYVAYKAYIKGTNGANPVVDDYILVTTAP